MSSFIAVSAALIMGFGIGADIGPPLTARFMAAPLRAQGMFIFLAIAGSLYYSLVLLFRLKRPERLEVEKPMPFMISQIDLSDILCTGPPRRSPGYGSSA